MRDSSQRAVIIESSFDKFRKHGIRRVTMDEIARDLRISKKTLYQHFPDKEALVRGCIEHTLAQILPEIEAAFDGDSAVGEILPRAWQVLSKIPRLLSVELMSDLRSDYPHLWEEIDRRRHVTVARVEGLLVRGIASGQIRPGIHPKVMMRMIAAIMERVLVPDVLVLGEFSPADAFRTVVTIVTRGVFTTPPMLPPEEALR